MNVLCSASTQRCVMTSVSCSMSAIRFAFVTMLAPVVTSDRNSLQPSTVSVLLEEVVEAGLPGQEPTEHGGFVTRPRRSRHSVEPAMLQELQDARVRVRVIHDPGVGRVDLGVRGHARQPGLLDRDRAVVIAVAMKQ